MKFTDFLAKKHISSFAIILVGFLVFILIGTLFLCTPLCSQSGKWTPFIDALFTATSATCVTGLVVHDTATYWNLFGQILILIMIQIGGIGVVTSAVAIAVFSGKKIGLMQRSIMQDAIAAPQLGGIIRMTGFIIKGTLFFELIGACIMAPTFIGDFGWVRGIWYSIFHSVSAFCNAGFDLMGIRTPYSSLTSYVDNPAINIAVMGLIIIGGVGFMSWSDIVKYKWRFKRYRLQTKIILSTSVLLIGLPALYYFFGEFVTGSFSHRLMSSLFMAITPRTAGFNTVDLGSTSQTGQFMTIILMMIGGSPGSTAGGMKITTVVVLALTMNSTMKRRSNPSIFDRRIETDIVRSAATIFFMYISMLFLGTMVISRVEGLPLLDCMYETASAINTVGLTLGITSRLSTASRLLLILYMYIGRVGGMTLAFAAMKVRIGVGKMPAEKIMVG